MAVPRTLSVPELWTAEQTVSGNQLGWVLTDTSLATGRARPDGNRGQPGPRYHPAVLASAHSGHGFGTSVLGANLTLAIPLLAFAGPYEVTLAVTAVTSLA